MYLVGNRRKPDDGLLIGSWTMLESARKRLEDRQRLLVAQQRGQAISYELLEEERKRQMQQAAGIVTERRALRTRERNLRRAERSLRWLLLWSLLMGMALMGWMAVVAVRFFG